MVFKLRWIASIVGVWAGVAAAQGARPVETVPGMPPVPDPANLYSETRADKMSPAVAGALPRIYVPNRQGNDVTVIDPATMKVVDRFPEGINPQHVVPSWDLKTLWVTNNAEGRPDGSLTRIDLTTRKVLGYLKLSRGGMPQDIRSSPDGTRFFVADMKAGGVFVVDGATFTETAFIKTGIGTHGLYPSRDGTKLYVANRGTSHVYGPPKGKGSVSVIDFATRQIVATWPIPGGGSPDMGNVSVDGKVLWLSGRFDNLVYAIDTTTGEVRSIRVGKEPHGLTVWPQPGRYSLGHTGNMR